MIAKYILVIGCFLTLCYHAVGKAQYFQAGEELCYEVSFMGLSIGEIKIRSIGNEKLNKADVVHIRASIKTYDNIPFIKADAVYDSWLDNSFNFSHKLEATIHHDKTKTEQFVTEFNFNNWTIGFTKYINKKLIEEKTVNTAIKYCEGMGLVFLIRKLLNLNKAVTVPTIMGYDTSSTVLNFRGVRENIAVSAFDGKVDSWCISGKGRWTGVYGVTGDFKAWFSNDLARVPLKAQLKLYIGMVDVELKQCRRKSWLPPPAV